MVDETTTKSIEKTKEPKKSRGWTFENMLQELEDLAKRDDDDESTVTTIVSSSIVNTTATESNLTVPLTYVTPSTFFSSPTGPFCRQSQDNSLKKNKRKFHSDNLSTEIIEKNDKEVECDQPKMKKQKLELNPVRFGSNSQ